MINIFIEDCLLQLKNADINHPLKKIRLLLSFMLNQKYEENYFNLDIELTSEQQKIFQSYILRLCKAEPLSKITGEREFWSHKFCVTKDTLDPRPDSETLISSVLENIFDKNKPLKIVDYGTGSGCLLLSLLTELPNAYGLGVDKSEKAILVAKKNAENLNLLKRVSFCVADWGKPTCGQFDIIISNPPYIRSGEVLDKNVFNYDPHLALFGGPDGLDAYRSLMPFLKDNLHFQTKVFLEIGQGQKEEVVSITNQFNLKLHHVFQDLAGINRVLYFQPAF